MMCISRPTRKIQIVIQNSADFVLSIKKLRVVTGMVLLVCSFKLIVVFVKGVKHRKHVWENGVRPIFFSKQIKANLGQT